MDRRLFLKCGTALAATSLLPVSSHAADGTFPVSLTPEEWRARLTPTQFALLRQGATEEAESSPLHWEERAGSYHCVGCDQQVYSSQAKFYSDSGWPAFSYGDEDGIEVGPDPTYGAMLPEVHCTNCGGHMGHIFNDGPEPTGERHCINGAGLTFKPAAA